MAEINDLNIVDASNTARFPEGQAPSTVNNGARALEGIVARWHKDTNASKASTGSANAYVFAADQTLSAYYDGLEVAFDANFSNTGAATLNVDAVGAASIKKHTDFDLEANDIRAGQKVVVIYDGTNWQMVSPSGNRAVQQTIGDDITVIDDDAGATEGPRVNLYRDSATPASSDLIGSIRFQGNDDLDNVTTYGALFARIETTTDGSEDGRLAWRVIDGGANRDLIYEGGAILMPTATGGIQTLGSLNATDIFDDGVKIHALADGLDTEQASTSGTAIDFTGIRSDAHRITIMFEGVSLSGTDALIVQLGDSVGFETSGYVSTSVETRGAGTGANDFSTTSFIIRQNVASDAFHGHMVLTLMDGATNKWIQSHTGRTATNKVVVGGGSKSLSDTLTQVRITRSGTNIFDGGSINILVE